MSAPRKKSEAPVACTFPQCPKRQGRAGGEITLAEQRTAVRTLAGMMHLGCWQNLMARNDEILRLAIAEGRHTTDPPKHLCSGCREMREIYSGGANDQGKYCFKCYIKQGGLESATEAQLLAWERENPMPDDPTFPARCSEQLRRRNDRRAALTRFAQGGR